VDKRTRQENKRGEEGRKGGERERRKGYLVIAFQASGMEGSLSVLVCRIDNTLVDGEYFMYDSGLRESMRMLDDIMKCHPSFFISCCCIDF
jgi:hypothetical protein